MNADAVVERETEPRTMCCWTATPDSDASQKAARSFAAFSLAVCSKSAGTYCEIMQLHALAYNLGNFLRTVALPDVAEHWSLTTLRDKLIKIGGKIVRHGRYVTFQMAEVAVPRALFADILRRIDRLRSKPAPA